METLTQKLWRKFKEFIAWTALVVASMSTPEKQVVAIVVMVVAIAAVVFGFLWSSKARAETVSVMCPKEFNFCYGSKAQFQEIIDYNSALAKELSRRQSCGKHSDI